MIGIYKITNKINNQCYIGYSTNIQQRWTKEYNSAFNSTHQAYNYPLQQDFRKYKKEDFSFEIIEECSIEELREKEKYWIKYYNSFYNGYNQTIGGEGIHKITSDSLDELIYDLKNTLLSLTDLSKKYCLNIDTIRRINAGRMYFNNELKYPLRNFGINTLSIGNEPPNGNCQRCGKLISEYAYYCQDCMHILNRKVKRPSKEELEKYLYSIKGNFVEAGKHFGVSDNSVRKWCKAYNLPFHSNDYKVQIKNLNKGRTIPKKVLQFDMDDNFIAEYNSIAEACRAIGKPQESSHISGVCSGKRRSAGGYKWKYKE